MRDEYSFGFCICTGMADCQWVQFERSSKCSRGQTGQESAVMFEWLLETTIPLVDTNVQGSTTERN